MIRRKPLLELVNIPVFTYWNVNEISYIYGRNRILKIIYDSDNNYKGNLNAADKNPSTHPVP